MKWNVKSSETQRVLEFNWEEHGSPSVQEPPPPGLGSALIDSAIPTATVSRKFHADGLVCTLQVPV